MTENTTAKILLVDDDPEVVRTLKEELELEAFEVITATNGEEGLKIAAQEKPSLILLDLYMPKLDGLTMLRSLRENAETKGIPVIVFSNYPSDENIKEAYDLGISDFIPKFRFSSGEVIQKIQGAIKT